MSWIKSEYFDAEVYASTRDEALEKLLEAAETYFGGHVQADFVTAEEVSLLEGAQARYLDGQTDVVYKAWGTFEPLKPEEPADDDLPF